MNKEDFASFYMCECMYVCVYVLVNIHKLLKYKKRTRAQKGIRLNLKKKKLVFRNFYHVHSLDVFIPSTESYQCMSNTYFKFLLNFFPPER